MQLGFLFVRLADQERGPDLDEAITCFRRAVELAPTARIRRDAMHNLTFCLQENGNEEQALAMTKEMISVAPLHGVAYYLLVESQPELDATDDYATLLREHLRSPDIPLLERRHLHYALGHLYDRGNRPGEAFAHFRLANQLRARVHPALNATQLRADVHALMKTFTVDVIKRLSRTGSQNRGDIFVVGMPRSGTTLLEQMLSSHSNVRGLGERSILPMMNDVLHRDLRLKTAYPHCITRLSAKDWHRLATSVAEDFRCRAGSCAHIVTKYPEHFWHLGLIVSLMPRAKIIHCRRDPIDTCLSCYMQNFGEMTFATNLETLTLFYGLYREVMAHWRTVLPPSSMFELSYEDLVREPESILRRLCTFCGIPFEEDCLEYYKSQRIVDTASRSQVRVPIYNTSVRRWHRYREFLGPLLVLARSEEA